MATITLNGNEMVFEYGFYIKEHYNQTLNTGKIIFPHVGKLEIEPMDDVVIADGSYTKNMVVSYYKATIAEYGTPNTYNYEVELVSHTIGLQRILLPNRSITQPLTGTKKTIWDVISHYLQLYHTDYASLDTDELQAFTETTVAPEMAWNNPTLFEVINDLLSVLKAVVTMPDRYKISYLKRDEIGSEIATSKYYNIEYAQSIENYAYTLQSELKNVYVDYVNYRSQHITPRTVGSPILDTSNVSLILDKPIGLITKVIMSIVRTEQVDEVEGVPVYDDVRRDVDITSHVVPKQVYDLAKVSNSGSPESGNYKRDLLYYIEGGTTIDGLAYNENTWYSISAPMAIANIFYNETSGADLGLDYFDDISFYVEYITAEDVKFDTDRDMTISHDSIMPNAQTTSYVDLLAFSKQNKQLVNSMSNDDAIIYGRLDTASDVPELSDYIDEYITSQRMIVFEDGFVEYTAQLSKNYFSAISFTGINAERRYTSIASGNDALLSHHLNKLYFLVTKEVISSPQDLLTYLWSVGVTDKQIGLITFDTDVKDAYGIIGSAHYTTDSILYSIRMEDNYNVGMAQDDVGIKLNQSYTPYVDDEGEFTSFVAKFYIGNQNADIESSSVATFISGLEKARALPNLLFTPDVNDLIYETDTLYRYKDDREITAETWQFMVKGDDGIYITPEFFRDSAFFGNSKTLKVLYSTTQTYNKFSEVAVGTDASATITVVDNKLHVVTAVTGATSWALTSTDGDTYIMVNGDICDLYMKQIDGKTHLAGVAAATITLSGSAVGWKSTDYLGAASGSFALSGVASGWKSTDYVGSASGLITLNGSGLGWKSTNYYGSAAGLITMTGDAEGWKSTDLFGSASGSVTFIGSAEGYQDFITYTVDFRDYDGTLLKTEEVIYGGSATPPSDPTRTGYTFNVWDDTSYLYVEGDLTITATYTANDYTVNFNANGGSVSPTSKTVTYDETYGTLPTPTRSGYNFDGWFTSSSGGSEVTASNDYTTASNTTLYAQWTAKTYVWVSVADQTPTTQSTTCSIDYVGDVRCDASCVYVESDVYLSMTDDTATQTCTINDTQTVCVDNGISWTCTVYMGTASYSDCEECTEV